MFTNIKSETDIVNGTTTLFFTKDQTARLFTLGIDMVRFLIIEGEYDPKQEALTVTVPAIKLSEVQNNGR